MQFNFLFWPIRVLGDVAIAVFVGLNFAGAIRRAICSISAWHFT